MTALVIACGALLGAGFIVLLRAARGERLWPVAGATGLHRAGDRRVPLDDLLKPAEPARYAGFHDGEITVSTPLGAVRMGFRYCPAEHQTVAVIVHPDGSATCADTDCGTHIPTIEEGAL